MTTLRKPQKESLYNKSITELRGMIEELAYRNTLNSELTQLPIIAQELNELTPTDEKKIKERKGGQHSSSHQERMIIRDLLYGCSNPTQLVLNATHDGIESIIENSSTPITPTAGFDIFREYIESKKSVFESLGVDLEEIYSGSLMLTRPYIQNEDGLWIEDKSDLSYFQRLISPTQPSIILGDKTIDISTPPTHVPLLVKRGDKEDVLDDPLREIALKLILGLEEGYMFDGKKYSKDFNKIIRNLSEGALLHRMLEDIKSEGHQPLDVYTYAHKYLKKTIAGLNEDINSVYTILSNSPDLENKVREAVEERVKEVTF